MIFLRCHSVGVVRLICASVIGFTAQIMDAPGMLRAQDLDCGALSGYWNTIERSHISSLPELQAANQYGVEARARAILRELVEGLDPHRDLLAQSEVNRLFEMEPLQVWQKTLSHEVDHNSRSVLGRIFSGENPGCQLVREIDALKQDLVRAEERRRSLVQACSSLELVSSEASSNGQVTIEGNVPRAMSNERAQTVEGLCTRIRDRVASVFRRKRAEGLEPQRAFHESQVEVAQARARLFAEPSGVMIARAMARSLDPHSRFLNEQEVTHLVSQRRSEIDRLESRVSWVNGSKVGVIRFRAFFEPDSRRGRPGVSEVVAEKVFELMRDASIGRTGIEGLVIDLRDNGGGAMREAVEMASLFIDQGVIHFERLIDPETGRAISRAVRDEKPGMIYSGPLIVLTSNRTASAAEIFAGAIQAHRRGPILGTGTTFGKGVFQLGDRNRDWAAHRGVRDAHRLIGSSLLTVGMYFTPAGQMVQGKGVSSDVVLEGGSPEELPLAPNNLNGLAELVQRPELESTSDLPSVEIQMAFRQQVERARVLAEQPSAFTVAAREQSPEWGQEQGFIGSWVSINQPAQVEAPAVIQSRDTALLLVPMESQMIPFDAHADLAPFAQGAEQNIID